MRLLTLLTAMLMFAMATTATAADTAEVKLAKRVFLEKMGQGRFDKLDEIYGPGFVAHGSTGDFTLEQDNQSGRDWRAAFPDLKVIIERTAGDKGLVAVHWRAQGTNSVVSAGMPGKGAKADVQGMTFFRFASGRIVEEWSLIDVATLMTQMGL
jgi:steroid delta-isomerase-like uncharacterized protein